ncbi:MAG: hypothetical protein U1U88_000836 [Lawsonella clevelandensis]
MNHATTDAHQHEERRDFLPALHNKSNDVRHNPEQDSEGNTEYRRRAQWG